MMPKLVIRHINYAYNIQNKKSNFKGYNTVFKKNILNTITFFFFFLYLNI